MGNTLIMINYGYIIDNTFETQEVDLTWDFVKWNQDQTTTNYSGIETSRDLSADNKVVIIGNREAMANWLYEYVPQDED